MKKLENIIIVLSFLLFLIITPVLIISLNKQNLSRQMQNTNVYSNLNETQANVLLENVLSFFNNKEELSLQFAENEREHMQDVKTIFNLIKWINLFAFILILCYSADALSKKKTKKLLKNIKTSSIIVLIVSLIKIIFLTTLFQQIFTLFHVVFFPQGNWMFPANSLLITLFPQAFFVTVATQMFLFIIGLNLAILGICLACGHKKIRSKKYKLKNKK